jgi:hypothetical protein
MNKQELIEKYQQIYEVSNNTDFGLDPFSRGEDAGSSRCSFEIVEDLKKLDEPQKVKARLAKHWDEDLGDCLWWDFPVEEPPYCGTPLDDDFPKYKTHFTELHIPDEVEEEPKYYIRLTIPNSSVSVIELYLGFDKDGKFDTSYVKPHITWGWKCRFTEKEIKAIDERYWPFAVPVEKV